jgi:hypothetical protein
LKDTGLINGTVEDVTAIEYKLKLKREEEEPDATLMEYATRNSREDGDVARLNGVHTDVARLDWGSREGSWRIRDISQEK